MYGIYYHIICRRDQHMVDSFIFFLGLQKNYSNSYIYHRRNLIYGLPTEILPQIFSNISSNSCSRYCSSTCSNWCRSRDKTIL
ncbi:F-box-like domain-containing protein [Alkalihalophilus marmarensis]|uniref:F-box-like domain-containing protein n=1 Tax=Alkalihalophilus marmarensis TaxID=521377 RepID=UPI003D818F45